MIYKDISTNDTLDALIKYCEKIGRFPTTREWDKIANKENLLKAITLASRLKKSWSNLRKELGYENSTKLALLEKRENEKALAIEHLKLANEFFGGFFSKDQYEMFAKKNQYVSVSKLCNLFGKFNNAKIAAGLTVELGKDKYSDEDLKQAIIDCSNYYNNKLFSEEQYEEWRKKQSEPRPHIETIRHRAGYIPELKTNLKMKYNEIGVAAKDISESYCYSCVQKFIDEMLSNRNYKKWSAENDMPDIGTLSDRTGLDWEKLKIKVLNNYITLKNTSD